MSRFTESELSYIVDRIHYYSESVYQILSEGTALLLLDEMPGQDPRLYHFLSNIARIQELDWLLTSPD